MSVELVSLTDAEGVLGRLDALFPSVPYAAWEPYRDRYPELFDGPGWRLRFGCFLIRTDGPMVLVDTGVGPPPGEFFPQRQGRLLSELAGQGVEPVDVDLVFLTHLHVDHVGWNLDADGAPTFPRARYVTSEEGWRWSQEPTPPQLTRVEPWMAPLARAGMLDTLDGETEIAPGVTAFGTPGHLPGHMSLRLESGAVVLGDVAVHPAQLAEPEWRYVDDEDGDLSVATRKALRPKLAGRVVACGHYPGSGIGRLGADGAWIPI